MAKVKKLPKAMEDALLGYIFIDLRDQVQEAQKAVEGLETISLSDLRSGWRQRRMEHDLVLSGLERVMGVVESKIERFGPTFGGHVTVFSVYIHDAHFRLSRADSVVDKGEGLPVNDLRVWSKEVVEALSPYFSSLRVLRISAYPDRDGREIDLFGKFKGSIFRFIAEE